MNDHDRQNFNFLMGLNEEEFESFFSEMPEDDIQYAIELIQQARTELMVYEQELLDSSVEEFNEAREVLARIMAL